jgi:YD repeat-containing protein
MKNSIKNILVICLAVIVFTLSATAQSGTTQYVYDDNGRLKAIIAPNGETSVYEYDAAGNILSITRRNTPVVSISSFGNSQEDCVSTDLLRIIISGTGFIPDISQNTVTFTGAAAAVEAVTQNEMTVVIPANFSAGIVRVTNANGFAEKQLNISSFETPIRISPNSSPRNFSITNVGQMLPLCFGGTSSKHISILLGNVGFTSLDIDIITPNGNTISSQNYSPINGQIFIDSSLLTETGIYFIKLSSPLNQTGNLDVSLYEFDDISTNLQSDGTPISISITKPGQKAKLQPVANGASYNLSLQNSTINDYSIQIVRNSDGQIVRSISILPAILVNLTSDYTIIFDPSGSSVGSAELKLQSQIIQIDGTPEIISISSLSESAGRTFAATAGQSFTLQVSNITVRPSIISVVKPDGNNLTSSFIDFYFNGAFLQFIVPTDGVYTILFTPYFASSIGSGTFSLNLLSEATGTLIINNPATTFTSTLPGQPFRITVAGNQGQRFSLRKTADNFFSMTLTITNPDGTQLLSTYNFDQNTVIDVNNLPQTGNYTIYLQPNFSNQFNNLTLRAIDNNVFVSNTQFEYIHAYFLSEAITDLQKNSKTIKKLAEKLTKAKKKTSPEQTNLLVPTTNYFYEGTANEQFSFSPNIAQPSLSLTGSMITLYKADGTVLYSAPLTAGICGITLPETGTYRIEVAPDGGTQDFVFVKDCGGGNQLGNGSENKKEIKKIPKPK